MKICLCITRLKSDLSEAISKNFFRLAEELTNQGHDVTMYSPVSIDVPSKTKLIVYSKEHSYQSKFSVLKNIKELSKRINKDHSDFDAVHIHAGFLLEAYLLGRKINKFNTPLYITLWQPYLGFKEFSKIPHLIFLKPKDYLYHFVLNSFLGVHFMGNKVKNKYNKIIVSSNYQKEQLTKILPEKIIKTIPNGLIDSEIKKESFNEQPNIIYIGHFTSYKGTDALIKSLYFIKKEYPETKLTLAYSGYGSKPEIIKLIKKLKLQNNVILKNKIEVYSELAKNDFLIIPYKATIGTSHYHNVLLEAMSVGVPIFASKIGSIPELINNEETGIFINPKKPHLIAKKVINTFANKELIEKLSENEKRLFQEKFIIKRVAQQHLNIYGEQ